MRSLDRVLTSVFAGTLALASLNVPTAMAAGPSAADQAKLKDAERLYKEGKTKFETADYEDALAKWKEAYSLLPDTEDAHVIRNALVYNISEAQVKAYEINRNVTHLRKAKLLLEDYLASHRQLYGDDAKANKERSDARERVRQVEKMIAEAEARGEKATPIPSEGGAATPMETVPEPVVEPTEPQPPEEQKEESLDPEEQAQRDREEQIKNDPVLKAQYDKATGQLVGGIVMGGIGVILLAVGGAFVWAYSNCSTSVLQTEGTCRRVSGTIALVAGIPGLGLAAGGAAMIGIGAKRRSALKDPDKPLPASGGAPAPAAPAASIGPMFLRDGGGAAVTVRF